MLRCRKQKHQIRYGDEMDSIRLRRLGAYRFSMFLEDASPENVILSNYKTEIVRGVAIWLVATPV
jgi:hypothetical protein